MNFHPPLSPLLSEPEAIEGGEGLGEATIYPVYPEVCRGKLPRGKPLSSEALAKEEALVLRSPCPS